MPLFQSGYRSFSRGKEAEGVKTRMSDSTNIIKKIKRTILVVDDEIINQEILKEILSDNYEVLVAGNGIEALDCLKTSLMPVSLILLDINMPLMNGMEFISAVKRDEKFKKIPIIVSTGEKETELKSLELGAVDFITKPYDMPEIILARVNRSIELSEDRMIIQASERDELTGVYSMHIFPEYVVKMDTYNRDTQNDMIVVNIEKFHLFNELYGREEGNKVLQALAEVLKEIARKYNGIVGRLQADYFVLYIEHRKDYGSFVEFIIKELEEKFGITGLRVRVGIYIVTEDDSVDDRIDRAKRVCDEIKSNTPTDYLVFTHEMQEKTLFNERLIRDMKKAINEKQFEVYYQPKINVAGEKNVLSSAEALIRWNHPKFGFISPGVFIPLFENNGSIRLLDRFVWEQSAKQIRKWKDKYGKSIPVSVNVSRVDMFDSRIVNVLNNIVSEAGISPSDLYIEITESAYNNELDQMLDIIHELKELGFKIEIDDFGSGYSSLNTLTSLSFDIMKLDMQFVRDMLKNEKTLKMVNIVAEIGEFLNVPLVAEGVETKEQCEALKKFGYEIIQGYYFSKPLCAADFETYIEKEEYGKC